MRALALCVALAALAPARAREPAAGAFLVATPQVAGFFEESVIVLLEHDARGSLGLMVNRPLGRSLAALLPELEEAQGREEPVFLGGPVAQGQMLVLARAGEPPEGATRVLEGVYATGSQDVLRRLLAAPGAELRAFVGYAGWSPGQLDAELARGDWLVAPADVSRVFTAEPEALWEELFRRHRAIEARAPARRALAPGAPVAGGAKSITLSRPWRSAAASSASRTSASPRSSTR
jgi:putative transcriptional regulator